MVAILGVLASAAASQYRTYLYKARRSEAFYGLRATAQEQKIFYAKNRRYSDSFAELGPPLESGRLTNDGAFHGRYYTFTLNTWDLGDQPDANYRATATADLDPSDDTLDIVIVENRMTVFE